MWSRMWRASTARRRVSCPSRCLGTTAAGCIPTRACGRRANRYLLATRDQVVGAPSLEGVKMAPDVAGSLLQARDCLENADEFVRRGDVCTSDFLDMWISSKRKEHDELRLRTHPYEFFLYYDV